MNATASKGENVQARLHKTLVAATATILRPLIRVLLRYGVGFSVFSDLAKRIYIDVAEVDFPLPGKKQTASRISTMTGLSRKEVARVQRIATKLPEQEFLQLNRASRVVAAWIHDKRYCDSKSNPLEIAYDEGQSISFVNLAKQYAGDVTARTIADELLHLGMLTTTAQGKLKLNAKSSHPGREQLHRLARMGEDVADLIRTLDYNAENPNRTHVQRCVSFHDVDEECLEQVHALLIPQAQRSFEHVQSTLQGHIRRAKSGKKYRIGFGMYYFQTEQGKNSS